MHEAEIRINYAALQVSLIKARMLDASEALWDWAEEWLDFSEDDREDFERAYDISKDA